VIDLASRRVHIVGSTRHPDNLFMRQVSRTLTTADIGVLRDHTVLICDRDRKWSEDATSARRDQWSRPSTATIRARIFAEYSRAG
jgi:hypothetical protein